MSIHTRCPACGKALRLKDGLAGKRVKCPACGARLDIPAVAPPPPEEEPPAAEPARRKKGTPHPAVALSVTFLLFVSCCGGCVLFGYLVGDTDFDKRIDEYTQAGELTPEQAADLPPVPVGKAREKFPDAYVKGRVLVVDLDKKKRDVQVKLPDELAARRADQVGTLVWLRGSSEQVLGEVVGRVDPPARAPGLPPDPDPLKNIQMGVEWRRVTYRYFRDAIIVDKTRPAVVAKVRFDAEPPGFAEFAEYLAGLPRQP